MIEAIRSAAAPLLGALPAVAWLPHKLVRKANGKLDKPPCEGSDTASPGTWFTLDKALERLAGKTEVAGIGFAITEGIIALDYDDCRDEITGELNAEVAMEMEHCNSYAYVTPSQKGIRIVGTNDARIPGGKKVRYLPGGQKVEIFIGPTNHYNTFTANQIDGYTTLRDISDNVIDYLQHLYGANGSVNGFDKAPPVSNPDASRSIGAIRAALTQIPNPSRNWDEWSRIGMAAWRSSGGSPDGFEAWCKWSAKLSEIHDEAACEERWSHWGRSPPTKLGFGTLYYEARRINPLFVPPFEEASFKEQEKTNYDPETGEVFGETKFPGFEATPLSDIDLDNIPPRRWIYGRELVRGYVSVLASPGGVGKTAYTLGAGVSVALSRPLLTTTFMGATPLHCTVHKAGNVWFYNLEDPMEEMRRRIKALLLHYKVRKDEIARHIYIDSGRDRPLIIAIRTSHGDLVAAPVVPALVAELKRRGITLLVVDPFVQSHSAEENRNEEMNLVMALWGKVANDADCSVWLVHHFRKGGKGGDVESVRGAGAIQGAARSMFTISVMTSEEADKLGVPDDQCWQYIRHDNVKQNMAPQATNAVWYRLVGVELGNGTDEYPEGDFVQTIEAWVPPSAWGDMPWPMIENILSRIDKGLDVAEFYAYGKQSKDRWAGHVIVAEACKTEGQAAAILKTWKEAGVFEEGQYASPRQKGGMTGCIRVNPAKFAEMRRDCSMRDDPVSE